VLERSTGVALAEIGIYIAATIGGTLFFERSLMREVGGYLRRRARPVPAV
jgi:hypothetical protein